MAFISLTPQGLTNSILPIPKSTKKRKAKDKGGQEEAEGCQCPLKEGHVEGHA